jgi:hypothetical protein
MVAENPKLGSEAGDSAHYGQDYSPGRVVNTMSYISFAHKESQSS